MFDTTKCRGRWHGIIGSLTDIPANVLDGKHHACPVTGEKGNGTGRFRFSNKDGRGNYFCACSEGNEDGFGLLKCKNGWEFKEACKEVEKVIGEMSYDKDVSRAKDRASAERLIRKIERASGPAGDHVRAYLASRGIEEVPGSIRQVRTSYGIDRELDAMVVRIRNVKGEPISLHLTYLEDGKKAQIETPRIVMTPSSPSIKGGAARLFQPTNGGRVIGVAEGVETALSVRALHGVPCWAVLSTSGMESFEVPADIKAVGIYGDWDAKFGGQKAAYSLAHRLATQRDPVDVRIAMPEPLGGTGSFDWNDRLRFEKGWG